MRHLILLIGTSLIGVVSLQAQFFGVKADAAAYLYGNANIGLEVNISPKLSLDAGIYYSVLDTGLIPTLKPSVYTGLRYWFYETSAGHFMTAHYLYAKYSRKTDSYRYSGRSHGAGISYGYQWLLSNRWNFYIEAGIGISRCRETGTKRDHDPYQDIIIKHSQKTVLHPSRVGAGFTFLF